MSTRPAALAGTWYPAGATALAEAVDACLAAADAAELPAGRPFLALAPHAGYMYSGAIAGRLFGCLRGTPVRRLVILAPNHRVRLDRPALSGADYFETPLGAVAVDTAVVVQLAATGAFAIDDRAHRDEHAIEIQLPLAQRCWPDGCPVIVPILVPPLDQRRRLAAAAALTAALDETTLLLVSSDLTHYGAAFSFTPFATDVPARIERLDSGALLRVLAGDGPALLAYGERTGITMCGLEAAALGLACGVPAGHQGALLGYARSGDVGGKSGGDVGGDYTHSVSYAAAVLTAPPSADGGDREAR